jgi:hypothetical protein
MRKSSSEFVPDRSEGKKAPCCGISCRKTEFSSASTPAGLGGQGGSSNALVSKLIPPNLVNEELRNENEFRHLSATRQKGTSFHQR